MSNLLQRLIGNVPPDITVKNHPSIPSLLTDIDRAAKVAPIMEPRPKSATALKYPRVKSAPVYFFLTPLEKKKLIDAAVKECGGNVSEYIRRVLHARINKA